MNRDGNVDPERLLASMRSIDVSAHRMASMVDQLLGYARLHVGRSLDLHLERVDLVELARSVVVAQEAVSEQHVVHFETSEPALVGAWDQERLGRVIQNLLSNAIKYSPAGGDIWVRLTRADTTDCQWAQLTVQDPGVGVPGDDLNRIFEGFHRGSNVAGRIAGTGIWARNCPPGDRAARRHRQRRERRESGQHLHGPAPTG